MIERESAPGCDIRRVRRSVRCRLESERPLAIELKGPTPNTYHLLPTTYYLLPLLFAGRVRRVMAGQLTPLAVGQIRFQRINERVRRDKHQFTFDID